MAKLILPNKTDDKPSISDLLDEAFEEGEVGGPSGFGWHALSTYMSCQRKCFYAIGLGLRKGGIPSDPLNFGTLMHACLALKYRDKPERQYEPIEAIREHYPELAEEATRTLKKLHIRYNKKELETWDPRHTEYEARIDFEGRPSFSDTLLVPAFFTCRYDLVTGIKSKDEERKPPGEVVDAVRIVDHKFHGRMFWDLLKGYGWDPQFIAQSLLWRESGQNEKVGQLQGVTLSIFIRAKTQKDPMTRISMRYDDETLDNFFRTVEQKLLDCHAKLLYHREDKNMWPQNFTACSTKYGPCPFFELCESNDRLRHMYVCKSSYKTSSLENALNSDKKE